MFVSTKIRPAVGPQTELHILKFILHRLYDKCVVMKIVFLRTYDKESIHNPLIVTFFIATNQGECRVVINQISWLNFATSLLLILYSYYLLKIESWV
jgi:hypothetical protein